MRLQVWAVEHYDIEDYAVRGLYRSRAAAESKVAMNEVGFNSEGAPYFRRHGDACCGVVERFVEDEPELPYHGPEVPFRVRYPNAAPGLIPSPFTHVLIDHVQTPLLGRLRGLGPVSDIRVFLNDVEIKKS